MQAEIKKEGNVSVLVITLPIAPRASKTGKTTIIAGTNGFMGSTAVYDGKPVSISVNATIK